LLTIEEQGRPLCRAAQVKIDLQHPTLRNNKSLPNQSNRHSKEDNRRDDVAAGAAG
jgi:hypothetical protein